MGKKVKCKEPIKRREGKGGDFRFSIIKKLINFVL